MNWVDGVIIGGLLIGGVYGWRAGLIRCLLGLAAVIGSVWLSLARGAWVGDHFGARLGVAPSTAVWMGAGLLLCVSLAAFLLLIALLERVLRQSALGPLNAIGGGIIGLLNGSLCLGLGLSFLNLHPPHSGLPAHLAASSLARPVQRVSRSLVTAIRGVSPSVEDLLGRMKADRESVVSRSPGVAEEISRRAGQVRAEVDTLLAPSPADSAGSRATGSTAPGSRQDSTKAGKPGHGPKHKPVVRDTAGVGGRGPGNRK